MDFTGYTRLKSAVILMWEGCRGARVKYDGPVSLHSEYQGPHSWRDLTTPELIRQTAEDLAFVKSLLKDRRAP